MKLTSTPTTIFEDLHKYEIPVADNKDIIEDEKSSPISFSVIPNYMGINLCSVRNIEWERQDNGELTYLKINFLPANPEKGVDTSISTRKVVEA